MSTSHRQWLVEDFRLNSPVKEFQDYSREEMERLRMVDPGFDDTGHRQAVELVLRRLRGERRNDDQ